MKHGTHTEPPLAARTVRNKHGALTGFQSLRRIEHPHRVTYLIDETMWTYQMGFTYDRDSWLRDIAVAPGLTKASLDGTTGRGTTRVRLSG
jgi:hypothetical protein